MLNKVKINTLKSFKCVKLNQIILGYIKHHATQPHNSNIAYKIYREEEYGQNRAKAKTINYAC